MDIEWAKDGQTGELFILQARPETVQSRKDTDAIEIYHLKSRGKVLITGRSVGEKIAAGPVRVIKSVASLHEFRDGRDPRHRQDRPGLGADHEEGDGHRDQSRRPHVPRRNREPRARRAGDRRHRARHGRLAHRIGSSLSPAPRATWASSMRERCRSRWSASNLKGLSPPEDESDDERRQPRGGVRAFVHSRTTASASPARSSSSPPTSRPIRLRCSITTSLAMQPPKPRLTSSPPVTPTSHSSSSTSSRRASR